MATVNWTSVRSTIDTLTVGGERESEVSRRDIRLTAQSSSPTRPLCMTGRGRSTLGQGVWEMGEGRRKRGKGKANSFLARAAMKGELKVGWRWRF